MSYILFNAWRLSRFLSSNDQGKLSARTRRTLGNLTLYCLMKKEKIRSFKLRDQLTKNVVVMFQLKFLESWDKSLH